MSDPIYAYAAGIIDGEGTITLSKRYKADRWRRIVVSVANTDVTLINYLKDTFGGTIVRKTVREIHHLQPFQWTLKDRAAFSFLERIKPFLMTEVKVDRMNHILNFWKEVTPRNGKYSGDLVASKQRFEDDFFLL